MNKTWPVPSFLRRPVSNCPCKRCSWLPSKLIVWQQRLNVGMTTNQNIIMNTQKLTLDFRKKMLQSAINHFTNPFAAERCSNYAWWNPTWYHFRTMQSGNETFAKFDKTDNTLSRSADRDTRYYPFFFLFLIGDWPHKWHPLSTYLCVRFHPKNIKISICFAISVWIIPVAKLPNLFIIRQSPMTNHVVIIMIKINAYLNYDQKMPITRTCVVKISKVSKTLIIRWRFYRKCI